MRNISSMTAMLSFMVSRFSHSLSVISNVIVVWVRVGWRGAAVEGCVAATILSASALSRIFQLLCVCRGADLVCDSAIARKIGPPLVESGATFGFIAHVEVRSFSACGRNGLAYHALALAA